MVSVYINTPTRQYHKFDGTYEECKKYITDNKSELISWGYFFTIRDVNFVCLYRYGSQLCGMFAKTH